MFVVGGRHFLLGGDLPLGSHPPFFLGRASFLWTVSASRFCRMPGEARLGAVAAPVGVLLRVLLGALVWGPSPRALGPFRASGVCSVLSCLCCCVGGPPREGGSQLSTGLSPLRRRFLRLPVVPGAVPVLVAGSRSVSFTQEKLQSVVVSRVVVVVVVVLYPVVVGRARAGPQVVAPPRFSRAARRQRARCSCRVPGGHRQQHSHYHHVLKKTYQSLFIQED